MEITLELGTFVGTMGILAVNIVFYAKKWKTGVGKE